MKIHVRRLDDETLRSERADGIALGDEIYRIASLDPEDGLWEFAIGDVVRCRQEWVNGERVLFAFELSARHLALHHIEEAARAEIGEIAAALVAGSLSWVEGAQLIRSLGRQIPAGERSAHLVTFFAISDETDDVSQILRAIKAYGSDGQFDGTIAHAEDWARRQGFEAGRELLRAYSGA